MWFSNRSDTNRHVQLQKQAKSLKSWSSVEEELYYPSSENKSADQLRGYLCLWFRICRVLVFSRGGLFVLNYIEIKFASTVEIHVVLHLINSLLWLNMLPLIHVLASRNDLCLQVTILYAL